MTLSTLWVCRLIWAMNAQISLNTHSIDKVIFSSSIRKYRKSYCTTPWSWPWWLNWICVRLVIRRLRVRPLLGRQHHFMEIDHETFSTVILSLLLIQRKHFLSLRVAFSEKKVNTVEIQTSLGPWKFVLDMGSSSHWELIIAPGQEVNGDNLGMSYQ